MIVLSRKGSPELSSLGATVKIVDYTSPSSLTAALTGVHTIISTISVEMSTINIAEEIYTKPQLALLEAAKAVGSSVKRFAPSEWTTSAAANHDCAIYAGKLPVWDAVVASGLEYTAFRPGVFTNFLGHGSPHPQLAADNFDGLNDFPFDIDVAAGTARIPGSLDVRLALTTTQDIGRFVIAALDLPDGAWPEESGMAGWIGSYGELIAEVEKFTGKKLVRQIISKEEIEAMKEAETNPMVRIGIDNLLMMASGDGYPKDLSLNRSTDVKPTTVADFMQKWWA